ncbi:fibronectin type III domain-containing protein [Tunturibacter psychrotolerans]|uniref:Fibronectin type III domain-containing protein n=1 Tax=Tunturiibacter psychrotolerans TaxID=3069686 RepID=A0AAU7ZWI0_9BACT
MSTKFQINLDISSTAVLTDALGIIRKFETDSKFDPWGIFIDARGQRDPAVVHAAVTGCLAPHNKPATPTNLSLTSGPNVAQINPDGTVNNLIVVEWDSPKDKLSVGVDVQYQLCGTTYWISVARTSPYQNLQWIGNTVPGKSYDVRIRSARADGSTSSWLTFHNYTVSGVQKSAGGK